MNKKAYKDSGWVTETKMVLKPINLHHPRTNLTLLLHWPVGKIETSSSINHSDDNRFGSGISPPPRTHHQSTFLCLPSPF
uniref:Uncharacterized protein n=1 Tax=Kalanchoe fedtschenkoi TaxID=63787 RepID=A0A7N0UIY5_KALFE